jgi:hypothetical protein
VAAVGAHIGNAGTLAVYIPSTLELVGSASAAPQEVFAKNTHGKFLLLIEISEGFFIPFYYARFAPSIAMDFFLMREIYLHRLNKSAANRQKKASKSVA